MLYMLAAAEETDAGAASFFGFMGITCALVFCSIYLLFYLI